MKDTYINRINSLLRDFSPKDLEAIYQALWNLSERSENDGYKNNKRSNHRNVKIH